MTQFQVVGQSCRGISRLWVFDFNNKPAGNYRFDMPYELPVALDTGDLVFHSSDPDCRKADEVRLSIIFGLPESIGSPCSGDIDYPQYLFEKTE